MSIIYRKSLKGIDEIAFKSAGLPMRLVSYLLAVDGESSIDQLSSRNQHLPSMQVVLQGLAEQGFLEVAGNAANVVDFNQMRVGNGAVSFSGGGSGQSPAPQNQNFSAPAPQQPQQNYQAPSQAYAPPAVNSAELDTAKAAMVRDVSSLLGADAAPVISKIQNCRSKDDLFSTMMGIKKIITIYANREAADRFGARYAFLSN
jgi:hypothetical protein